MFFIINIIIEISVIFALFSIYGSLEQISQTLNRLAATHMPAERPATGQEPAEGEQA